MHNTMGMLEMQEIWMNAILRNCLCKVNSIFGDPWLLILSPSCYYNIKENRYLVSAPTPLRYNSYNLCKEWCFMSQYLVSEADSKTVGI